MEEGGQGTTSIPFRDEGQFSVCFRWSLGPLEVTNRAGSGILLDSYNGSQ
jgi:hypothetical protein